MKLKLSVGALACLSTLGSSLGAGNKIDVFGMTTGMTVEQIALVGEERGWRCKDAVQLTGRVELQCITKESQKIEITFAKELPGMPVMQVFVEFNAVGKANVISALNEQYGQLGGGYWILSNGSTLQLQSAVNERTFYLTLKNSALQDANRKVADDREKASHPVPKF